MRIPRFTWLLLPLVLIGVYFLQHNPNSTRAEARIAPSIPVIGGLTAALRPSPAHATSAARAAAVPMLPFQVQSFSLFAELWRTDGDFVSTIRIKNSLITGPLTVTPVLYMADGTEYDLPAVALATAGVAVVDINGALSQAPPNITAHLSQYGSAALRYQSSSPGHVRGSVQILNLPRSLSFVYSFSSTPQGTKGPQMVEGLWWKRDAGVGGFVSVANVTDGPIRVGVRAIGSRGGRAPVERFELAMHSTAVLDLDELTQSLSETENQQGGVRVEYVGEPGAVLVAGGLVNEREGYSENIPFCPHDMAPSRPTRYTYASVGIMVGQPEPMMGFPSGTTFSPYVVVRNTTAGRVTLTAALNYMAGQGPVTRTLPPLRLDSWEARQLDVAAMMRSAGLAGFSGNLNLTLSYLGQPRDLVVATGSVDQTGTYVFAVEPQGPGPSSSKEDSYWTVADGWDTMINLWNPEGKAQDFTVTFYYADGSGQYVLPVHLDGQASTMIDMMQLIADQRPDPQGRVIPQSVQMGSAVLSSSQGVTHKMTLAVSAATFNVVTATCCTNKVYCYGYTNPSVTPSGYCLVGATMQCTAQAIYNNGNTVPVSGCTWSSSNTAVATINSSGLMTGVSAGSVTITAQFPTLEVWSGTLCPPQTCPTWAPSASAPETVQVPTWVSVISDGTQYVSCDGHQTCQRLIRYQVMDGEATPEPIQVEGMKIAEYIFNFSQTSQCQLTEPTPATWYTDSTGSMYNDNPDTIGICSAACYTPGESCTATWNQSFKVTTTVNGVLNTYRVGVMNTLEKKGQGSCNNVSNSCGVCPTVVPTNTCPNLP